jgi:hypothetical protein
MLAAHTEVTLEVSDEVANQYKYVAQFEAPMQGKSWTVVIWNNIGPDGSLGMVQEGLHNIFLGSWSASISRLRQHIPVSVVHQPHGVHRIGPHADCVFVQRHPSSVSVPLHFPSCLFHALCSPFVGGCAHPEDSFARGCSPVRFSMGWRDHRK